MILTLLILVFSLPLFLLLTLVVFYLPGKALLSLRTDRLEPQEDLFLSFALGIVFFICLAVVLGLLNLRFLSLPVFCALNIFALKKGLLKTAVVSLRHLFNCKILILVFLAGIVVQGLINFPSGLKYPGGVYFWSSQGHDGLWHVALMEELKLHFPPQNPLYAGKPLQNYHFSADILMGEFFRLFPFLSSLDLYFRFFPVIFSFLIGLGVYSFAKRRWSQKTGCWAVFFTYFCGSFGYIVSVFRGGSFFTGETTFWASQGNTILGNPPHTLGIILLTAILVALQQWVLDKKRFWLFVLGFLGFGLATVKVSSGAVLVAALTFAGGYYLLVERKLDLLLTGLFLGVTNFALLKVISPGAESFLIFEPLWFSRNLMTARLGDFDWELRRQHYLWVNSVKSWLRVIQLETQAVLLFIVGNSGLRIMGILAILGKVFKSFKKLDAIDAFLYSALAASLGVVLLFIQKGLAFNLIQFIQIYLHFLGIFAAVVVAELLKRVKAKGIRFALAALIIFLAAPTAVGNLLDFYGPGKVPLAKVTPAELEALSWLRQNSRITDIVLTKPFAGGAEYRYQSQPWPISGWYSTPYVFVFSGRYAYLSGEEQLMITGYKTEEDLTAIKAFFARKDWTKSAPFLREKGIRFIYLRKDEMEQPLIEEGNQINKVFENDEVVIFKVI